MISLRQLWRVNFPSDSTLDVASIANAIAQVCVALIQRNHDDERRALELEGLRIANERARVEIEVIRSHPEMLLADEECDGHDETGEAAEAE